MPQVPAAPHFIHRLLARRVLAGLAGGLSAGLLLSLLDWWLLLHQGGRWLGGDFVAALSYAYLFLGPAGGCTGVGLALAATALEWLLAHNRPERLCTPGRFDPVAVYAICFVAGAVPLIRFGWMPHWKRSGITPPGSMVLWVVVLLAALAPVVVRSMLRRGGGRAGRSVSGRRTAAAVLGLVFLLAGATVNWLLAGSGGDASAAEWRAPDAAAVNREDSGAGKGRPEGPPVVVLLLDTLRWDALSCYGNGGGLTPHLDRFCREAVQFEVARAQASWTKPSIATLLTSTGPRHHGARGRADRIRSGTPSLARLFRQAGYRTGAVVANGNLSPAFGFARGFDDYLYLRPEFALGAGGRALGLGAYRIFFAAWQRAVRGHRDHRHFKRDAAEVNEAVLGWIDRLAPAEREAFFLFVNYVDAHDPYFSHPYDGRALGAVDGKTPSSRSRNEMAALYDGEVAYLDRHLGRLFAHLRRLGLYERSVIVVTSDHGEEFLDHGGWWHGLTLFEEQVRVPLLVRLPGGDAGGSRARGTAGLIDVAPGVLELAGLGMSIPDAMTGRSMAHGFAGGTAGDGETIRVFLADELLDGNNLASLTEGQWKYVRANPDNPRGLPREALYNLTADPAEEVNLVRSYSQLAEAMSLRMDQLCSAARDETKPPPQVTLDEETVEHLRALGYLR